MLKLVARATREIRKEEPAFDIVMSQTMSGVGGGDAKKGDSPLFCIKGGSVVSSLLLSFLHTLKKTIIRAKNTDTAAMSRRPSLLFCLSSFVNEILPVSPPMMVYINIF
jgi:hypothetical protein